MQVFSWNYGKVSDGGIRKDGSDIVEEMRARAAGKSFKSADK